VDIATILFLGIVALSGAAYAYYWHSPGPEVPHLSAAIRRSTIGLAERERSYLAYVPANLSLGSALIIVLHGSGMDGKRMRECTGYEFDRLADQCGFVVLYPNGYRHNWNDCRKNATFPAKTENIDDVSFVRALISRCKAEQAIDDKRVYVFGYSNGGHMAFRLAMEAPDEIAAVAAVAASLPSPDASSCPQQGRTSRVMLVNGTFDPVSPYQGGVVRLFGLVSGRGTVLSAKESARALAERNGITAAPVAARLPQGRPDDPTSVASLTWFDGRKPVCCLYTVQGGGHVIPQQACRFPRLLGKTSSALNAPREAVRFFESHTLA
jgi:polyhydroxybutyrate depolymerase